MIDAIVRYFWSSWIDRGVVVVTVVGGKETISIVVHKAFGSIAAIGIKTVNTKREFYYLAKGNPGNEEQGRVGREVVGGDRRSGVREPPSVRSRLLMRL